MTGPASSGPRSFDHHPHPKSQRLAREEVVKTESLSYNFPSFSLSFRDLFLRGAEEGRQSLSVYPSKGFPGCNFLGYLWGDTEFTSCSQAALFLSLLWMPALLPVVSRLLLLPRALLSMASGSPPSQPSPASGSAYAAGSVSAAFVTCPNEKVAKEIARWGPQCGARKDA